MAQNSTRKDSETPREKFLEPVVLIGRCLGLFLDVVTLMPRMLWNTLVHDTPHGKTEPVETQTRRSRA